MVVQRARLCMDFTVSMYVFHLGYCIAYDGFPGVLWWGVTVGSCVCTTVLGEYMCMRREMMEIPIVGVRRRDRDPAKESMDPMAMGIEMSVV